MQKRKNNYLGNRLSDNGDLVACKKYSEAVILQELNFHRRKYVFSIFFT